MEATTLATVASPVTFTIVLHMSSGLSIAIINAKPCGSIQIAPNTITNIISPAPGTAAAPIEERVAVKTITN